MKPFTTKQQFQGFLNTPFLFKEEAFGLQPFQYQQDFNVMLNQTIPNNLRLGKLVERFVFSEFSQHTSIKILAENIQIQDDKITVGELDCIVLNNEKPCHLEIIYKFYLYDANVGSTEIDHWIGPNRKDSLQQKLTKLTDKQFPLLHHQNTKPYLESLNLSSNTIEQYTYFKAQLFLPLADFGKIFPVINNSCITGFYITKNQLLQFKTSKFYIPTKHNWLVEPITHVDWLNYNDFIKIVSMQLHEGYAPMCWIKNPNGQMFKCFVVWWS